MSQQNIAIVGGGILGCLIAKEILQSSPDCQLTIIDSGLVGAGASQFSAGVHFPVGRSERVRKLSLFSERYYAQAKTLQPDLPIYPVDFQVASPIDARDEFIVRCQRLTRLATAKVSPLLADIGSQYDFWQLIGCHFTDVYMLVQRWFRDLQHQAQILESTRVEKIEEKDGKVHLGLSLRGETTFDRVILAPGPWMNTVPFKRLTSDLGLRTKRVVALHCVGLTSETPALFLPSEDIFLVPFPHRGHALLSYTCDEWDVNPEIVRQQSITSAELAKAQRLLHASLPQLTVTIHSGRMFCDAYSKDYEPVVRTVGESGNIVFAGACNGAGYRLAPGIAQEVTQILF
ncbi:FAD-binding oxidoreductase [Xenorhabdus bovienii]|uniref:NAD(P)/FAD-dependent oxidoreductase n=1 Tax=Xenorhabdus bovienii TaxID=40576 RepID=UPI001EDEA59A|nr:FAD-dependent oxidoreductase [Xenorhabdus bovienii]MCG3462485.1 FAD-binding oxidoreductase [Xenorhabdus bovienii]